jgi:hypothetical protein
MALCGVGLWVCGQIVHLDVDFVWGSVWIVGRVGLVRIDALRAREVGHDVLGEHWWDQEEALEGY